MDDVTYRALASAVMATITDSKPTLSLEVFDKMLQAHGETPTGAGRKGRQDWNYQRNLLRKNLNTVLRRLHGVSLEVHSQSKVAGVQYYLAPLMERMLQRPLEHSEGFKRRVFQHFREINKAVAEEYPPPGEASLDEVKAWEEFALAKAELMQKDYNLSLRYMAKARGLGGYLLSDPDTLDNGKSRKRIG